MGLSDTRTARALKWLDRQLARTSTTPTPPNAWTREGALAPLLIGALTLAPFPLAGVFRTVTHLGIIPSFCVALIVVGAFLFAMWPSLRVRCPDGGLHLALGLGAATLLAAFCCYCLYNRYFGGLTNYRGTDTGFHVQSYYEFVRTAPDVYNRFVSLYAALYFVQHLLRVNVFWALVVVFYAEVTLVAALPISVTFSLLWPLRKTARRAWAVGVAATLPIAGIVQYLVILPQQHQNQADGFYPHLFAMVPLFAIWLVDALARQPLLRHAALFITFVAVRFTYGLNLGDLALALAVITALDARDLNQRRSWRIVAALVAVTYAGAGLVAYRELWPVHTLSGHVVAYDVPLALKAQACGLAVLVLLASMSPGVPRIDGEPLRRAARFPFWFALVNGVAVLLYVRSGEPRIYYFFKYPMAALFLVACACAALMPAAIARVVADARKPAGSAARPLVAAAMALTFTVVAVSNWYRSMPQYRVGFVERAWGKPPFLSENNLPLADLGAWSRIEKLLHERHKRFGGYVVSQFGMMIFMNAALEVPGFGWNTWFSGPQVPPPPGYCIFWDEGSPRSWWIWELMFPLKQLRMNLELEHGKTCTRYRAHWDPDGPPRVLCSLCY